MKATCSISDLAAEFKVMTRSIRFYEDQGLIATLRQGTRRLFRPRDCTRLKLILRGNGLVFRSRRFRKSSIYMMQRLVS